MGLVGRVGQKATRMGGFPQGIPRHAHGTGQTQNQAHGCEYAGASEHECQDFALLDTKGHPKANLTCALRDGIGIVGMVIL